MPEITFEVATVSETHTLRAMGWRNDPDTLRASFHSAPKVWPDFLEEYRRDYFADPSCPPLFGHLDGTASAFFRFRPYDDPRGLPTVCREISIILAPEARGRRLSVPFLRAATDLLRGLGVQTIVAEVLHDNRVSELAFQNAGFTKFDDVTKHIPDINQDFEISRYLLALVPRIQLADGREIGPGAPVFIVAEAGSNWRVGSAEDDLSQARKLIDAAAAAGADAVKFQTYRADTVYVANAGSAGYLSAAGVGAPITKILDELAMPYPMVNELAAYCRRKDIRFMSTPFSAADADAVDPYVTIHKVASYEISHLRLIEHIAKSGKPMILSTGASNLEDIKWAVDTFRHNGGRGICLMQCTASYPAPLESLNLRALPWLERKFGVPVGFSDHSLHPIAGPVVAVALGASVIEKHFTLNRELPGPDHAFALEPAELTAMVEAVHSAESTPGNGVKLVLPIEEELYAFARRGLQATRDILRGEILKEDNNFAILRPGQQSLGLHPKHLPKIEGRIAAHFIPAGHGIQVDDLD